MLEIIGTAIALDAAAKIATWCFNDAAERQRALQRNIIDSTYDSLRDERSRQRQIERDARQSEWEANQAARQAHHEMLGECWDSIQALRSEEKETLGKFRAIIDQNKSFLQSLALTPEQRAAVHECNDQLQRGMERLRAFIGPYLQQYLDEVHDAQVAQRDHEFITPDLPSPVLPESFPFSGELMEFEADELENYPFVDLGHRQRGRFVTASRKFLRPEGALVGMISRYCRDTRTWIISAARAELALELSSGDAFMRSRPVMLAEWRGDARIAWWQHRLGEKVMLRFEEGNLSQRMRRAPWGTPVEAFVQSSDFFVRWIRVGERVAREHQYSGWTIPCSATQEFWDAYTAATDFSEKLILRQPGMAGDPSDATLVLRLATGHEFPLHLDEAGKTVVVGKQCGQRLGLTQERGKNLFVFLLRGTLVFLDEGEPDAAKRLFLAVQESFEEQRDLGLLAEADALELKKYRAVLQAEFEASKRRKMARLDIADWAVLEKSKAGKFVVRFEGNNALPDGLAVRVQGENDILGWSSATDEPGRSDVVILREKRRAFRDEDFPRMGKLEAVPMDRDLINKMDGIEDFLSAAATETRTSEEQAAFSILRRELLGHFQADPCPMAPAKKDEWLDEHQQRAVSLLAGSAPLVLIQGPPGTGKTHVIAHAIDRILSDNPKARIAITSQANPAVDEAVAKIQETFPQWQIFRDYSAAAKEKYSSLDRGVGIDDYYSEFIEGLEAAEIPEDSRAAFVQSWLKEEMKRDSSDVETDMRQILSKRSQVLACTLSRLAGIAASAPAFDLVIVDEAAKASVPEAMVAANCAKRLALVGDHKQLLPFLDESYYEHSAPTSADQEILKNLWNNSLFSRLWNLAPDERKAFLAIMRRSRRPVAECISACFYNGELIPGRDDTSPTLRFPLSLLWIDSGKTRYHRSGKTSIQNRGEVDLIFSALEELPKLRTKEISVAVIAFHRGQVELLQAEISKRKPQIEPSVLTVDASQGGQWDVVILTLARTKGGSGFVGNPNRLNVALSRAKELCIVVGSKEYAKNDRTKDSSLSEVVGFMDDRQRKGTWMVFPQGKDGIPSKFGFPPPKKRRR